MRTEDIQPLSEHRAHLTEHLKRVQESGRPLFVTSNGRTAAVVLSPERYDEMISIVERFETMEGIQRGLEDVKAGRTYSLEESKRRVRERAGLLKDRDWA